MKIGKFFVVIVAFSLFLCSCASLHSWKAKSFEKNKQYEEAISYYEKALEKKPDSEEYKQALDRVKSEYARVITERASDYLSSNPFNLETLDEVLRILEKAINLRSSYTGAEDLKTEVAQKREALTVKLNNLIRYKDTCLTKYDFDKALEFISKAIEIEPRKKSLKAERESIIGGAYAHFWEMSQDHYIKRQYEKALSSVEKALQYRSPQKASAFREKMVKAVEAEKLYKEAQVKLREKNLDAAIPILKNVLILNDEKEEARIALADVYYIKGNQANKMGNLLNALKYYRMVLNYRDPYKEVPRNIREIESKIAEICLRRVEEYLSSDLPGNAMLYIEACKKYLEHPRFEDLLDHSQRKIKNSFLWPTIAILDFSRSARSKRRTTVYSEAEVMIPDQIAQMMGRSHSAYLRPRNMVLDSLYDLGINLELIRKWDEKKLERLSSVVDAKFIVVGNIVEFDIHQTQQRESKTKRYEAGTRKIPNPEYSAWLDCENRLDACRRRQNRNTTTGLLGGLLTNNAGLALSGVVSGMSSCGSCGSQPPKYLEEKIYRDCNYQVYYHKIEGSLNTRYIVYDRDEGKVVIDKEEKTTFDRSDSETAGCRAAGVDEDPLTLPAEEEVAERLIENNASSFFEHLHDEIVAELPKIYLRNAENQEDSLYKNEYLAVANLISPNCGPVEECFKNYCEQAEKTLTTNEFTRLTHKGSLAKKGSEGRKWAVIIGINRYKDSQLMNLKFAQKDAVVMGQTLIRKCGFPEQNVKMLLGERAKRAEILAAINDIAQVAMPEDMVVIYFAGHGGLEADRGQPDGYCKYLLPHDSDIGQSFYATAIGYDEIASFFRRIRAKRLICFLDSCYSGAAGGRNFLEGATRSIRVSPTHLESLSTGKGRIIIAASDGNQPSIELYQKQHGVFTYFLVKGLNGEADLEPKDGKVTLLELFEYVSAKVRKETAQKRTYQEPIMRGEMGGGQIVLASLR